MSNKKEAIMQAFIELLDENPAKRITVNDIVTRCGVSRNTFYYYFSDIPELVNELEAQWVERVRIPEAPESVIDCIAPLVEYASEHRNGLLYVYQISDRKHFQADLERLWYAIVRKYIENMSGCTMEEEDRELLARFFKSVFTGVTLDWLDADMGYDLTAAGHRVCDLLRAQMEKGRFSKF